MAEKYIINFNVYVSDFEFYKLLYNLYLYDVKNVLHYNKIYTPVRYQNV